jgi:IclR family KDG regulon transcriptional repressor
LKAPELAKAVVKTMNILESLSRERSLGVTELANRITGLSGSARMHKSTVYRFLNSLKELGYVTQDPDTEQYSMTLKLFEVGIAVRERLELWREAQPVIKRIAQATGETIHLATLDEERLVYLGKIESSKTLRVSMMSRVGQSAPAYCTGLGKTLLSHVSPQRVTEILKKEKLVPFTKKTITTRTVLDRELETIRRRGYGIDDEEHEVGVRCVAAPVRDSQANVIAAVSISVPSVRLDYKDIPRFGRIVIQAADEISSRLGYGKTARKPARGAIRSGGDHR